MSLPIWFAFSRARAVPKSAEEPTATALGPGLRYDGRSAKRTPHGRQAEERDVKRGRAPAEPEPGASKSGAELGLELACISQGDESGSHCLVCYESWTNAGLHRVVSLKCGHLFGESCILRWLRGHKPGRCPSCNQAARVRDVRPLFVSQLTAVDTSEVASLRRQLEEQTAREERAHAELRSVRARLDKLQAEAAASPPPRRPTRLHDEDVDDKSPRSSSRLFASTSVYPSSADDGRFVTERLVCTTDARAMDTRDGVLVLSDVDGDRHVLRKVSEKSKASAQGEQSSNKRSPDAARVGPISSPGPIGHY